MEISIDTIVSIISLIVGGGGGAFFTWRWQRAKAKAEAEQAETSAAKEMQDMYQQLIEDVKKDRQDQREYIDELKTERNHLREDRDGMRNRIDKADNDIRSLKDEMVTSRRQINVLHLQVVRLLPFSCAVSGCTRRKHMELPDPDAAEFAFEESGEEKHQKTEIEPYNGE